MNEIIIKQTDGIIECDFASVKANLNEQLSIYRGLLFTEDTKKDAKQTVADLRKDKKALADAIKDAKDKYMIPWNAFEKEAKEVVAMFDEPIDFINEQVNEFEQKRRKEKQTQIVEAYEEIIGSTEWKDIIPFEKIYDTRWENATKTLNSIKTDMCEIKARVKSGVETIKAMNTDIEERAIQIMLKSGIEEACKTIAEHETEKRRILALEEERIKKETEERIRAEERAKILDEQKKVEEIENAKAEVIESFIPDVEGKTETYTYDIVLTEDAKNKLEMYMDSCGIEYTLVEGF